MNRGFTFLLKRETEKGKKVTKTEIKGLSQEAEYYNEEY